MNPEYYSWNAAEDTVSHPMVFNNWGFSESDFPEITFNGDDNYSVEVHFACRGRRDEKTAQCYDYQTGTGWFSYSGTFDHGSVGTGDGGGAILTQGYNQTYVWDDVANDRDFYSLFSTGADRTAMTAGYFSSSFEFDLVLYTEFGTTAYIFDWIMAMKVNAITSGTPIDPAVFFSPKGNGNWGRVRMNPLLRM